MSKNSTQSTSKESDVEASEEVLKVTKRKLFTLKKESRVAYSNLCKAINENKIGLIQGRDIEHLKQAVRNLEQLQEATEATFQIYCDSMETLEMFEEINKEEEKLEITQSESQRVRVQIYTLIARQERENNAADTSEILENSQPSSKVTSGSVPCSSQSSSETASSFVPRLSKSSSEITSGSVPHSSEVTSGPVPHSSEVSSGSVPHSSEITSGSVPHSSVVTSCSVPHSSEVSSGSVPHSSEVTSGSVPHSSEVSSGSVPHSSEVTSGSVPHSSVVTSCSVPHSSKVTSAGTATEEVFVESQSEDKMNMEFENKMKEEVAKLSTLLKNETAFKLELENKLNSKEKEILEVENQKNVLVRDLEDAKAHLKNKENKCKEKDSEIQILIAEREIEKKNLLDIIQGKEKALLENENKGSEMQMKLRRVKDENLEIESEKRNLSEEVGKATIEMQRLRESLIEKDQVILKLRKENEDLIKGRDAGTEHINKKPVLIPELESEKAEVLQMKMDKENMQTKLEMFQGKSKEEFSEMDKERQEINTQLKGRKKGALIARETEGNVHFEKLKGKKRVFTKPESSRNNWRLTTVENAFVDQNEHVERRLMRFDKRNLGNHRKRKKVTVGVRKICTLGSPVSTSKRPGIPAKEPYVVQSYTTLGEPCGCCQQLKRLKGDST